VYEEKRKKDERVLKVAKIKSRVTRWICDQMEKKGEMTKKVQKVQLRSKI